MNSAQHDAFQKLLRSWNQHHQLRTHHAPLATMVEARRQLDDARLEMARTRH
ncbi:MAG: hypothetical protein HKN44_15280 [Ilumatobacter sp.]|nr:hypothetical protein [Ilumatobacter sp.]